jgi:hypothetical protein
LVVKLEKASTTTVLHTVTVLHATCKAIHTSDD